MNFLFWWLGCLFCVFGGIVCVGVLLTMLIDKCMSWLRVSKYLIWFAWDKTGRQRAQYLSRQNDMAEKLTKARELLKSVLMAEPDAATAAKEWLRGEHHWGDWCEPSINTANAPPEPLP